MPRVEILSNKSSRKQKALGRRAAEKEGVVTEHQTDIELRLLIDEEKYKAVFESAGDIMMLIDKKGRIIDINGKSVEISGYSKEDVLGKHIRVLSKILTKKSLRTVTINFLKGMVGFNIPPYEIELIKKDGELLTFEVSAQPIKKDGKIIGDLGILRDISARKRAENEIRQHSSDINLINSINEAANEGKDFNEIFQLVSKETQKLFGGFVQIIYLLSEDKQYLEMQNLNLPPGMAHVIEKMIGSRMKGVKIRLKPGSNYAEILNNGKAVLDNDPAMMQNMAKECTEDKNLQALVSSIIKILGIKSAISVPLKSESEAIGLLDIARHEPFTESDMKRMEVIAGQLVNIIKRKQTEKQLEESENNLKTYLQNAPDGVYLCDLNGIFLYGNKKAEGIMGYQKDELIGENFFKLNLLPAKYLEKAGKLLTYSAMGRNTGPDEFELIRKDKSHVWVEINTAPIKQKNNSVVIGFVRNITERKQAEDKLEQAAQEWRTTFDSITDLISIHDKDNRLLRVNKAVADLLKKTPKELVGKFCQEVMHGTKEPPANCPHLLTLNTGKPVAMEIFNPNLEAFFHEATSPLFNENGEVIGSVMVARDVTKQKRMEEQLIVTDRLASIGELSSGVAHELNNPLTSVIGFSQLLMEGEVPDNMKENLATIYSEAQRAAIIVKNLLTFARKHAPVKQLTQVNTAIEGVLRLRAYEQKVNNIEVEKHFATDLPEMMMDSFQMQQVFLNIIVNAEFAMLETHNRGKLVISTEKSEDVVKISFTDDGPGISKENLKRIFDPFFTTKEVGKGTGLGLSICHGIVTEHGGQIYAQSEDGHGATFIVELPLNRQ